MRLATGARMVLTTRHVGEAHRRLGRTRDRAGIAEAETHGRTVDFRLPHTGESRACHQNRSPALERSYVSTLIEEKTVNQRLCSLFLNFLLLLFFCFPIFVGADIDVSQRSGFFRWPHETVARDGRRTQRLH